jgi:hypothetical protein
MMTNFSVDFQEEHSEEFSLVFVCPSKHTGM